MLTAPFSSSSSFLKFSLHFFLPTPGKEAHTYIFFYVGKKEKNINVINSTSRPVSCLPSGVTIRWRFCITAWGWISAGEMVYSPEPSQQHLATGQVREKSRIFSHFQYSHDPMVWETFPEGRVGCGGEEQGEVNILWAVPDCAPPLSLVLSRRGFVHISLGLQHIKHC